jgi:hypothetical protein
MKMRNITLHLYRYDTEEYPDRWIQCRACNWRTRMIYVLGGSQAEANRILQSDETGLCGDCMCDMLMEANYAIVMEEKGNLRIRITRAATTARSTRL